MAAFGTEARLVRLQLVVRLRRLGVLPWLLLLGWALFAAGQEPRLLRSFEIQVAWQGIWSGAAVVLVVLAVNGGWGRGHERIGHQLRISVNQGVFVGLALAIGVGGLQALLAWLADSLSGGIAPWTAPLESAASFAVAMAPASIAATTLQPWLGRSVAARIVLVAALTFSLGASAVCFNELGAIPLTACVLAAAGATCASSAIARTASVTRTPLLHANRHPR